MKNVSENLRYALDASSFGVSLKSCCARGPVKNEERKKYEKKDANSEGRTKNWTFNRWNMGEKRKKKRIATYYGCVQSRTVLCTRTPYTVHGDYPSRTQNDRIAGDTLHGEKKERKKKKRNMMSVSQSTRKSIYTEHVNALPHPNKSLSSFHVVSPVAAYANHFFSWYFFRNSSVTFYAEIFIRFYDALSCNGNRLSFAVWHTTLVDHCHEWWPSIGLSSDLSTNTLWKNN